MAQPARTSHFIAEEVQEPSVKYRIPFVQAGFNACRYIIGDPNEDAVCCGAPTNGKSWCAWHRTIVFEPRQSGRPR